MRQLPANSGGTGATENSRSRSQDSPGVKTLSNGSVKEPIVTRSKSRLRVGRFRSGRSRSPKKPPHLTKANESDGQSSKKTEKVGSGGSTNNHASPSTKNNAKVVSSTPEKMYARHYKSYRRLNGVKSRRGERSTDEDHSSNSKEEKETSDDSGTDSSRVKESRRQPAPKNNMKRSKSNNVTTKNHVQQNGISHSSSHKGKRSPSSRIRQLMMKRNKQLSSRSRRSYKEVTLESSKAPTAAVSKREKLDQKDKVGKRRSALWVLNCEAESFLFGETAAEKHEVELPPLAPPSPPPPKKRRWRATELGHLLEKSPILESKLRKSSSSESGSDRPRDPSPPRKRLKVKTEAPCETTSTINIVKEEEKTPEMCSSSSSSSVKASNQQVLSPKPELSSPLPFLYSPDSIDYEAKAVQFQQMLANLDWGYSFEVSPINEPWYKTFTRTKEIIIPHKSFVNPLDEQVLLPYEMDKPLRRSRCKPVRNSRKSPRCHASTLAILSSEKPTRSTRSSVTLDSSPSASVNNLQSDSTLSTLLISPTPKTPTTAVVPSTSAAGSRLSPPKYSPSTSRRRHTSSPTRPNQNDNMKNELHDAVQYLWDSIQLLSDPYVVALLAGDDPDALAEQQQESSKTKPSIKNNRCNNNNYVDCPMKSLVRNVERSRRKASLRSGDSTGTTGNTSTHSNSVANHRLTSVPKCSPRNQSHGTNHTTGQISISSPPVSPRATVNERILPVNGVNRRFTSRSPPPPSNKATTCPVPRLSPKNSKGTNSKQSKSVKGTGSEGDNGLISHNKASKKSSIVIVTDLFSSPCNKTKLNNWEEESLFVGDGLPPLPSWPV